MTASGYPPTIFVLGTQRDVGKTVTSVGVIAKLLSPEYGYTVDEIGYIKPVGQQAVRATNLDGQVLQVDKDAVLVTSLLGIKAPRYEAMSPVIWHSGLTADYIDDQISPAPQMSLDHLAQHIRRCYEEVAHGKKVVVVEGTGQPGVGSVGGISNADVINLLRAMGAPLYALMVTKAGIGATIDQLFPYLMAMDHLNTRIDGLVINGVLPDKLDKIRRYLSAYFTQVFPRQYGQVMQLPVPPIVSYVPLVPQLGLFSMRLIAQTFAEDPHSGLQLLGPDDFEQASGQLIRDIKIIQLRFGYDRFVGGGDAIILGVNANDVILSALLLHERLLREGSKGLAGLILSCNQVGGLSRHVHKLIADEGIPTIAVEYDSAEIIQQVESWTVKIQPYDLEKRDLITQTYIENLDLSAVPALQRVP
jgi:dethiobiotin synthetase